MARMFRRSVSVCRDEGVVPFFIASKKYVLNTMEDIWLYYKYRLKYGDLAPRPDERLWIDPKELEYTIEHSSLYNERESVPNYGVLNGSWDLQTNYWRDSPVWGGLVERFEEGKRWENTSYYQHTVKRLKDPDKYAGYLEGPKTKENLDQYVSYLDRLYKDMKSNGYDSSSVITVHIGREGEWIVGQGNHRRTLASIIGIESVPIRIKFRHRKWQNTREKIYNADSKGEIERIDLLQHPDIRVRDRVHPECG